MPPKAAPPEILNFPFFSLEYRDGVFARLIPAGAADLGGGVFAYQGKTWRLPEGEDSSALAEKTIKGKPLLPLLNRGQNPLIARGPRLAREGERLMELRAFSLSGALPLPEALGAGPLCLEPRSHNESKWLPLEGLPRQRLFQNVIYEIIDSSALKELSASFGMAHNNKQKAGHGDLESFVLKGEDIPRFAETQGRLLFQFGDENLKNLLAEDSVFAGSGDMSLGLGAFCRKGSGGGSFSEAAPLLRLGNRRYAAEEVSRCMDREYILLGGQWARRRDIEALGIFPLGSYAGGEKIGNIKLKAGELLRRGSGRLSGGDFAALFSSMEGDLSLWLERGSKEAVFSAHLEFLLAWGLSGGVAHNGHREQAAFLVDWLSALAARDGEDSLSALCLIEKRYYELYLPPFFSRLKDLQAAGGSQVKLGFYEELAPGPARRNRTDILILVEPEEAPLWETLGGALQNIRAGAVLGIFSDPWALFRGRSAAEARNLFGIKESGLEQYLIRDTSLPLALPRFDFPPPSPPALFRADQNPFHFTVEEKFSGLSGPTLYSELALFSAEGGPAPFVPLRLLKGSLDIERMDDNEKAFYLYWRAEFRRGNILKTAENYIRIYARELCLFSDDSAANFLRLLQLQESYGPVFDSLNDFLPRWLADYAAIYEMTDNAIPLLIPHARSSGDPMLADIYLYRHFIMENNSIELGDIQALLPGAKNQELYTVSEQNRLERNFVSVINACDRWLREEFRLKLFEFFFPRLLEKERREAFAGMERAGRSAYTVEGPRFSKHPPLLAFVENLFRYTEYCFNLKKGLALKSKPPPLDEIWKPVVNAALGIADGALVPVKSGQGILRPVSAPPPPRRVKLRESRLDSLRDDSNTVRELLAIEDSRSEDHPENTGGTIAKESGIGISAALDDKPNKKKSKKLSIKSFIKKLSKSERDALKIIASPTASCSAPLLHRQLSALAKKNNTMPELLIDSINAAFLEQSGDLLIETVDERPLIQPEYSGEVKKVAGIV